MQAVYRLLIVVINYFVVALSSTCFPSVSHVSLFKPVPTSPLALSSVTRALCFRCNSFTVASITRENKNPGRSSVESDSVGLVSAKRRANVLRCAYC